MSLSLLRRGEILENATLSLTTHAHPLSLRPQCTLFFQEPLFLVLQGDIGELL
jgi:hypothetical protein